MIFDCKEAVFFEIIMLKSKQQIYCEIIFPMVSHFFVILERHFHLPIKLWIMKCLHMDIVLIFEYSKTFSSFYSHKVVPYK